MKKGLYKLYFRKDRNTYYFKIFDYSLNKYSGLISTHTSNLEDAERFIFNFLKNDCGFKYKINDIVNAIKTDEDVKQLQETLKDKGLILGYTSPRLKKETKIIDFAKDYIFNTEKYKSYKLKNSSKDRYLNNLNNYLMPYFKLNKIEYLSQLNKDIINDFRGSLSQLEIKNSTKNQILKSLKSLLSVAYSEDLITFDLKKYIKSYSVDKNERYVISKEIAECIFSTEWLNNKVRLCCLLGYVLGLRIGEVTGLQKDDLMTVTKNNESYCCLFIRHSCNKKGEITTTKTNKEIKMIISPYIMQELLLIANNNPYNNGFVFWGKYKNKPIAEMTINRELKRQLMKCGFIESSKMFTYHGFRHLNRSLAINKISTHAISQATGHSKEMINNLYSVHSVSDESIQFYNFQKELLNNIYDNTKMLDEKK